ncbi:MAG: outer membrane lipoprotein-sorting protein [Verrucomicrobiales bacterium]|nr:outer membrane lipoprotein-sorting protein [Verrucomicrobiales bacterium]
MKFVPALFSILLLLPFSFLSGQDTGKPSVVAKPLQTQAAPVPDSQSPFAGKTVEQLTADEVLKLVRYSYTLYDRDFEGQLRVGFNTKIPFILSLKPEAIRFIFNDPAHVIYLDTKDKNFALYEGTGGAKLEPVADNKYGQKIRGTDVTYDDLSMRFLYWPDARIVDEQRVKNRDCWVVRVRNPDGKGIYSTVDCWVDKGSGGMLKMNGYNAKGRTIRRFEVLHGKKMGDIWMVDEMRIETISPTSQKRLSHTRLQITDIVE